MNNAIVNVGVNGWYPKGSQRLEASIKKYEPQTDFIYNETGICKLHGENPYGFKACAIKQAVEKGYKKIFWLDSSFWLNQSMQWAWDKVDKYGYLFFHAGWNVGQWCADHALEKLGIGREESFKIPLLSGGIMGLNTENIYGRTFIREYNIAANNGSFVGAWTNEKKQVSEDARVLGHRHDQTAASVIAWKLGMRLNDPSPYYIYRNGSDKNILQQTIFVAQGM